ncbi:MAG TPA: DNA repair protein RadC [Syntrophales bacterium]|jgi:DNA repair protein RadC|nr:DNA repair protein RadC [Syntrophales bacterium]HON23949.1 DNA repair protein RadC [Syntrophales bacterium]HOU77204.1 DNA repair protein RadC [Syntrophales bacterium]HPC32031.1 DNA repair protein RadC [Syntrophales bacterium]HQG33778.1 DNA repair protein RadC [Syntrophales bacterium]
MVEKSAPHYLEHRRRLKARFEQDGLEGFHEYEILELLLCYAIPQGDVKPLAKELLNRFGDLKGVMDAGSGELRRVKGVGPHTALFFPIIKDIGSRYLLQKAREKPQVSCTAELLDFCRTAMGALKDEEFRVCYLDAQNRILAVETIQEGIVNQAVVYPRKVLEKALHWKASAIILVHNHPSGHVRPSDADIRLTRTIQETARALDILVHDHLIIGENRFFSFREEGLMS